MDYQSEYNQMMKEGNKSQQKFRYLIIASVAFVFGFGLAWLSFRAQDAGKLGKGDEDGAIFEERNGKVSSENQNDKTAETAETAEKEEKTATPPALQSFSLTVLNQAPGKSVFVDEIFTDGPLWVVIIENNNGEPGNILGAGLFDAGETAGVVELLRGTVEGGAYYAGLYNEDSNLPTNRVFDLEKDLPLSDRNGDIIYAEFKTSVIPREF